MAEEKKKDILINPITTTSSILLEEENKKKDKKPLLTGFDRLDAILTNGVKQGLYVIGGGTGSGKTTFAWQIANFFAHQSQPVLYFALEMDSIELIHKALANTMCRDYFTTPKLFEDVGFHMTQLVNTKDIPHMEIGDVLAMNRDWNVFTKGCLYVYDTNAMLKQSNPLGFIKEVIVQFIKETKITPVVFIDYLQIAAVPGKGETDKAAVDRVMHGFINLKSKYHLPIFLLSSLNRASYTQPVTLSSFKESGSVEYGANVLLGLQEYGMESNIVSDNMTEAEQKKRAFLTHKQNNEKKKNGMPIAMELKVLKQRDGSSGDSILFDFYPQYATYIPFEQDADGNYVSRRTLGF